MRRQLRQSKASPSKANQIRQQMTKNQASEMRRQLRQSKASQSKANQS